ncbi:hypothetical protein JVU11DRAFT_12484 [Chiua virens]|nr:hypothetical protein JVU11DRAFT_12484 [Chiua virens]
MYSGDSSREDVFALVAEVRPLADVMRNQETISSELKEKIDELTRRFQETQNQLTELNEQLVGLGEAEKMKPEKDGANTHPALKCMIHLIFADFCGIERMLEKAERVHAFTALQPWEDGQPKMTTEGGQVVWHLNFKGTAGEPANAQFIEAVVKNVMENKKALQENNQGELSDGDYKEKVVRDCVKAYFRNLHQQVKDRSDPTKAARLELANQ